MAKPLKFLDEAIVEGHEAWTWYRLRSEKAGSRFQAAFEQAIEKFTEEPGRWPEYLHGTRYVSLKRFPYIIVYRESADELQVIPVAHGHRRQAYWKKRMQ